jgi:hypothetical protein
MSAFERIKLEMTRRHFFHSGSSTLGTAALASMLGKTGYASDSASEPSLKKDDPVLRRTIGKNAALSATHFPARAKNVIFMHMLGGPPQQDMFDFKPNLDAMYDKDLPDSVRGNQRLTQMTAGMKRFPICPSMYKFKQYGESGMWVSELLPHTAKVVDDLCFIRSMNTDAINHDPACTFVQTGNQITGRPSIGSWISYGLGSMNADLPTFAVMVAQPTNRQHIQGITARLWSSGYLPGQYSGVSFRTAGDPILYIDNPKGVSADVRRTTLDDLNKLNKMNLERFNDPETLTRIQQYEMAFKMQTSVPELSDLSKETEATLNMYGPEVHKPGSFAKTALMARRMVERGVRFVQIYHNNWDVHSNIGECLPAQCKDTDQGCAALIMDLKQRGLLDDTLVIWGGEFGRTTYTQGSLTKTNYGRDHHPRCFTMWMAGGGTKKGLIYGETDEFSYNVTKDPVHLRDFHATVLHLMGINHEQFTYRVNGLDGKLTGVEPAKVIKGIMA